MGNVEFSNRIKMDDKIKLKLLMALFYLLRVVLAVLGCAGVSNLFAIPYAWYQYKTNPMENTKDMTLDKTFRYTKGCMDCVIIWVLALYVHVCLLRTKDRYQKYIGNIGLSQMDAFYARYGRFFPQNDMKLKNVRAQLKKYVDFVALFDEEEKKWCKEKTEKRDLEYIHKVTEAKKKLFETLDSDKSCGRPAKSDVTMETNMDEFASTEPREKLTRRHSWKK